MSTTTAPRGLDHPTPHAPHDLPPDKAPARPRGFGPWRGWQGLAAALVVVSMIVWRGVLMAGSYFNQDDFYLSGRAASSELTWSFLLRDTAGHVNPLQQLTYWLVAHGAAYEWGVVAAFVLSLQTLATVVLWHVLSRLLPGRAARIPLLALFAWSPLTLVTTLWWSAAMGLWPHLLFSLLAVLFLVRARQGAGRRGVDLTVVLLAHVTGLLWHERAVLIAPVLLGVAVLMEDDVSHWRRVPAALRRFWVLWVPLGLTLAGYLVAHSALTSVEGGATSVSQTLSISWAFLGENVVPGVASGPWQATLDGGAVQPATWVVVVSIVLTALAGVLLLRGGGPGRWWALAFVVAYVATDLALVLAGRGGFGRLIGLDPRYSSDVVQIAVLGIALALRGAGPRRLLAPGPHGWRRGRTWAVVALTAAYLAGSVAGTAALVPHFSNREDRAFVENLRAGLAADPNQVLVDALAPSDVVLPLVGEDSLLSRILAPLPESPAFDLPSSRMRVVSDDGHLERVRLRGTIPMRPGPVEGCGYPVSSQRKVPWVVGVSGRVVVHVGYFTDQEVTVEIAAGGWSTEFLATPGPNEIWFVVPDLGAEIRSLEFSVDGSSTVCVADMDAGLPGVS